MEHPLVSMVNGTPTTSSILVARVFGKRHDHVLRDIEKIKAQVSENFSQPNFGAANYLDAQGKNRLMYLLTRDAFTLLAMGYTGKEAMQFKVKYIEAFNAMEEELKKQPRPQRKALPKEKDYSTLKLLNALSQVEMLMDKTFRYYRSQMCPYVQEMTARAAFDDRGLQTHLIRQTYQDTYLAAQYLQLAVQHTNFAYDTARGLKRVLEVPGRIEFF